jgi:hypothetical protein
MPDIECKDLNTFVAECRKAGVSVVVVAEQREYGQHPDPTAIRFERLHLATCLAYAKGSIIRLSLDGQDPGGELQAAGFTVERRSRNRV